MPTTGRTEEGAGTLEVMLLEHPVFTAADLRGCLPAFGGLGAAGRVIADWESTGGVVRVRSGLYAAVPAAESAGPELFSPYGYLVACKLAPDAVVSHHGALQFFGCAYSFWSEYVYSATVPRAPFRYATSGYSGTRYPAALLRSGRAQWGVVETLRRGGVLRVTSLERTFVDVLAAPRLAGGWEEVWRSLQMVDELDVPGSWSMPLSSTTLRHVAKVGYFLERHREFWPFDDRALDALRDRKPRRPQHMDRRAGGELDREWNLIVPHAVAEESWDQFYGYRW